MFESLTEKLQRVYKNLRGEGKLTEENVVQAMGDIRTALLEADVNLEVAKQLIERIQTKCLGQEVMIALSPAQQVVKIVRDEMIETLGGQAVRLKFRSQPPSVILMAGLQGSGKTTTSAKLAWWLSKNGHRPQLVSVDVYRPAAREQLRVLAAQMKLPYFAGPEGENNPVELARLGRREALMSGRDVLLVDTAGRLHIDEQLMQEMQALKEKLEPTEILFVADAMTGQDAVNSAAEFHRRLGLTGVILTKMDGDARGGAALSIRQVTGAPLKFVGTGEKYEAFEVFHPDRIAGRILGMGDVLSLVEKAQQTMDHKKARELEQSMLSGDFTLADFREQLRQVRKLGPMEQVLGMLPQLGPLRDIQKQQVDEKELGRVEAIINSMTSRERLNHQIINGSRRKRIAIGSGTTVQAVNTVLKQYAQARKMMKTFSGGFMGRKLAKLKLDEMLTKN
jgi:signal recognition particle subunit SRP54